jgi:hypothetical protein
MADASPALYAFVESGEVMYVGKTKRHLKQRLYGYLKPGKSQRTNVRVRARVLETLNKGDDVEILGFHDPEAQKIGRFRLNMAAALEDDIIEQLNPEWNGGRETSNRSTNNLKNSASKKTSIVGSLADRIRQQVNETCLKPAKKAGRHEFSVRAGDIHRDLGLENRMPAVCGALDTQIFQDQFDVILSKRSGPPQGSNVTWLFAMKSGARGNSVTYQAK